jgi:hypothetical protein
MWTPSDLSSTVRMRRAAQAFVFVPALCLVLGGLAELPAAAQPANGSAHGAASASLSAGERRQLRQQLERRYEPLAILNGVLLKARQERLGVRTVEVSGDSIVVNGARVGAEVLRSWLGEGDAEPILRLQALPPADRQELFGLKRSISTPVATAPAASPRAGAVGAVSPNAGETSGTQPGKAGAKAGAAREQAGEAEGEAAGRRKTGEAAEEGESGKRPPLPESPEAPEAPQPPPAVALPSLPAPPSPPTPPSPPSINTGSRVRLGGPVTVEKNEVADDVAVFGGPIHVEGEVSHDVVAFGGSVRINGRVGGDVHSIGGGVHLGPHSEVMGDVSAVGGAIVREPGANVHGDVSEAGGVPGIGWNGSGEPGRFRHWPFVLFFPFGFSLFGRMSMLLIAALLVLLAMVAAKRPLERIDFELATQFWKALLAGFLAQLLFLPLLAVVSLVLVISIIGCALFLLYPVIFAGIIVVALVGFAAACYRTGRWLERRFDWQSSSPWVALLFGFIAIEVWSLIASIFGSSGLHVFFIAGMFSAFGLAVRYVAWTAGFGGAILAYSRHRARRRLEALGLAELPRSPAPAPQPPPAAPRPLSPPEPPPPAV